MTDTKKTDDNNNQPRKREALGEAMTMLEDAVLDLEPAASLDTAGRSVVGPARYGGRIDRFVLRERIGQGGMGEVYAAHDPDLNRLVAVKVMRSSTAQVLTPAARKRLQREAQALAQLSHPNIVSVFESGSVGDEVFIAMEFIKGQTLSHWVAAQRRSARGLVAAFVQAGQGLAAAHQAGLVHRDFKPANVIVDADGRVRVLDFGIARAWGEADSPEELSASPGPGNLLNTPLTRTGFSAGTPGYMSPEQHAGDRVDARSDQFSFCVALFEALYGQRPFATTNIADLRDAIIRGDVTAPASQSDVPRWLDRIVRRGLQFDPGERYPSMDALLRELQADPWSVPDAYITLLQSLVQAGKTKEALALAPAAEASVIDAGDPLQRAALNVWYADALWSAGQSPKDVRARLDEAVALYEAHRGPGTVELVEPLTLMAALEFHIENDPDAALRHNWRAVAIVEAASGPEAPELGDPLRNIGFVLNSQGQYENAQRVYDRVVRIVERHHGSDHPAILSALTGLGDVLVSMGEPHQAVLVLERAVALAEAYPHPVSSPKARFHLARALWDLGADRSRAIAFAKAALHELKEARSTNDAELAARIEEWLAGLA